MPLELHTPHHTVSAGSRRRSCPKDHPMITPTTGITTTEITAVLPDKATLTEGCLKVLGMLKSHHGVTRNISGCLGYEDNKVNVPMAVATLNKAGIPARNDGKAVGGTSKYDNVLVVHPDVLAFYGDLPTYTSSYHPLVKSKGVKAGVNDSAF